MRYVFLLFLACAAFAAEANPFTVPAAPAPVVAAPAAPAPVAAAPAVVSSEPAVHPTQPASPVAGTTQEAPKTWWTEIIVMLAGLAAVWLRKKINDYTSAQITKAEAEAEVAGIDAKQRLVARAKTYVWRCVENYNQKYLPELCEAIARGQVKDITTVKERLKGLGTMLLNDVVVYFKGQDIDLIKEVGEDQIMSWIRSAVDEMSPFQKYPTAKALVEGGAEMAVKYGLNVGAKKFTEYLEKQAEAEIQSKLSAKAG